jgi:hypothetical protein
MSVAVERHVWVGFCYAHPTIKVQVPLEERTGASTVDVQVQSEGDLTANYFRTWCFQGHMDTCRCP